MNPEWLLLATAILVAALPLQEPVRFVVEAEAGAHAREGALVELEVPGELFDPMAPDVEFRCVEEGRVGLPLESPVQCLSGVPARLVWRVPGEWPAGETRRYVFTLTELEPRAAHRVQREDGALTLVHAARRLVRYHAEPVAPPAGVDAVFTRGGHLHPICTPSGRAVTGDFPPAHLHHHGVWTAWTRTRFEGRAVDFWNSAERQGRVEPVEVLHAAGGPHLAHLRVALRHVDGTAPGGARIALHEIQDLRAFALEDATVVDLELEQRCAGESPLELQEYHYGGLGWRGPIAWEGDACRFLTSEGADRLAGHATRARWCAITGDVGGAPVTAAILCHPANPRAPQPMRLHPSEPFFCYAPVQLGSFEITPDAPYRARYRLIAMDGAPDVVRIEELWRDWAEPPSARLVR